MTMAMMNYLPLRGMLSFSGGQISEEYLTQLLDRLNG